MGRVIINLKNSQCLLLLLIMDSTTVEEIDRKGPESWEDICDHLEINYDNFFSSETQPCKYEIFDKLTNLNEVPQLLTWGNERRDGTFIILNHVVGNISFRDEKIIPLDIAIDKNDNSSKLFSHYIHENFSKLWSLYRQKVLLYYDDHQPPKYVTLLDDQKEKEEEKPKIKNPRRDYLQFIKENNKKINTNDRIITVLELMNNWDIGLQVYYSSVDQSFKLNGIHHLPQNFLSQYVDYYYYYSQLRKKFKTRPIIYNPTKE